MSGPREEEAREGPDRAGDGDASEGRAATEPADTAADGAGTGPSDGEAPDPGSTAAAPHPEAQGYDRRMLEALVCPATRAPLTYDAKRNELVSRAAHLAYPIRGGIPIMLAHEARETE